MVWVARHGRQGLDKLEAMPISKFNNYFRQLIDIVSKEWEQPGE